MSEKKISEAKYQKACRDFTRQANAYVKQITAARDGLDNIIGHYQDILEGCDEGLEEIRDGIERISQTV